MLKFIYSNPFNLTCHLQYISYVIPYKIINMLVEHFYSKCNGGEEYENYRVLDYGHRVVWYRLTSVSRSVRPSS